MKKSIAKRLIERKRRIKRRLAQTNQNKYNKSAAKAPPELDERGLKYELSDRVQGVSYGGVPLMIDLAQKLGLTKSRFIVLVQLYRKPEGLSISEISAFHKVRSATMTGIIDTLEREGQIERVQDPTDRRKVIVRITEVGRKLMEDFLPKHQENIGHILTGITVEERQVLLGLMQKLHQGVLNFVTEDHNAETEGDA